MILSPDTIRMIDFYICLTFDVQGKRLTHFERIRMHARALKFDLLSRSQGKWFPECETQLPYLI